MCAVPAEVSEGGGGEGHKGRGKDRCEHVGRCVLYLQK